MSVFKTNNTKKSTERNCFFDEPVDIARYDKVRYNQFQKLTEKQLSFFWRPEEIDLSRDPKDFRGLTTFGQHIFTSNIMRQILLDSVQGRAPIEAFLPICSLPELENFIVAWSFFETIHSQSYTHIIRNVYSDPSKIFDGMLDIQEIVDCAKEISKYYDNLIEWNNIKKLNESSKWRWILENVKDWFGVENQRYNEYEHKKALWLCLNAVNALEGVRFYVSFACSWAFAELKQMEGNAKIIKFIARDENVHLAFTQQLLKMLPKEDPDFAAIATECRDECIEIFESVVQQEKDWARYLFKDGSMIGLNEELLCEYLDWLAAKRMAAIGLSNARPGVNPLPWTQKWIAGSEVQVAPQETEIASYLVGGTKQDVEEDTFKGFEI